MEKKDARPCVTAIIDLSGFSSHLEIGDYDIRTEIGISAINRLQVLEDALRFLDRESFLKKTLYPNKFYSLRFNDSIYLTMDLNDSLIPSFGQSNKEEISIIEKDKIFIVANSINLKKNINKIRGNFERLVFPLCKFVGFVSRIHNYIYLKEKEKHFPGVKTVIAFGLRKPYFYKFNKKKEDYFSANFSISTAYLASKALRGANFFVDNHIIQMLCYNDFAKNLTKYGQIIKEACPFDPTKDYIQLNTTSFEYKIAEIIQTEIFRKQIFFRKMNFRPLGYLQVIPTLTPYLKGKTKTTSKAPISLNLLKSIKEDFHFEGKKNSDLFFSNFGILNAIKNDIEEDLIEFVKEIKGDRSRPFFLSKKNWHERLINNQWRREF